MNVLTKLNFTRTSFTGRSSIENRQDDLVILTRQFLNSRWQAVILYNNNNYNVQALAHNSSKNGKRIYNTIVIIILYNVQCTNGVQGQTLNVTYKNDNIECTSLVSGQRWDSREILKIPWHLRQSNDKMWIKKVMFILCKITNLFLTLNYHKHYSIFFYIIIVILSILFPISHTTNIIVTWHWNIKKSVCYECNDDIKRKLRWLFNT